MRTEKASNQKTLGNQISVVSTENEGGEYFSSTPEVALRRSDDTSVVFQTDRAIYWIKQKWK